MNIRWNKVLSPGFIVAVAILLVSMLSMKAVLGWFGAHLIKDPVPLRRDLDLLTTHFGPYRLEERMGRLPAEEETVLGTTRYITWVFRDTRLKEDEPGALIRLHVPYYTGTIDSVPHVPDRCFVAGGATVKATSFLNAELHSDQIHPIDGRVMATTAMGSKVKLPGMDVPMTVVTFVDPNNQAKTYCVAYFFVANDEYVATPDGVRFKAFNFTDRYTYFCKIEVMPYGIGDPEKARRVVADFLSYALPEIMLCLPDWKQVQQGRVQPQSVAVNN